MGQIIPFPMSRTPEPPNRIREIRKARGMKLKELAFRVGCSESQMSDLEIGKRRLSDYWMERIAPVLEVNERDLVRAPAQQTPEDRDYDHLRTLLMQASDEQREAIVRVAETMVGYTAPPSVHDQAVPVRAKR